MYSHASSHEGDLQVEVTRSETFPCAKGHISRKALSVEDSKASDRAFLPVLLFCAIKRPWTGNIQSQFVPGNKWNHLYYETICIMKPFVLTSQEAMAGYDEQGKKYSACKYQ